MPSSLVEKLEVARVANRQGNLQQARQHLQPVIGHHPRYLAAQRLLAEIDPTKQTFQRILAIDSRCVSAYQGLGDLAAADGQHQTALVYHQVAWELQPDDPALRTRLEELSSQVLGPDGRLQWTRAALANLRLKRGELERAAIEFQRALHDLPGRVDLQTGLAETYWRLGADDAASRLARQLLVDRPYLSQALIITADISHRRGELDLAQQSRLKLREVDPDGELSRPFVEQRADAARDALLPRPEEAQTIMDVETQPVETSSPPISTSVLPLDDELLPAGFPDTPDVTPAYSPPAGQETETAEAEAEDVEIEVEVEPQQPPEERPAEPATEEVTDQTAGEEEEAPALPPDALPTENEEEEVVSEPELPSSDDLAAMLGVLPGKRNASQRRERDE